MVMAIIVVVLAIGAAIVLWAFLTQGRNEWVARQLEDAEERGKTADERQVELLEDIHREQKKHRPHLNFRRR